MHMIHAHEVEEIEKGIDRLLIDNSKLIIEKMQLTSENARLREALDATLEIMVRAIGDKLPIIKGTYCEEEDWQTVIRQARAALKGAL